MPRAALFTARYSLVSSCRSCSPAATFLVAEVVSWSSSLPTSSNAKDYVESLRLIQSRRLSLESEYKTLTLQQPSRGGFK